MVGFLRVGGWRSLGVLATVAAGAGVFAVGCTSDTLLTEPKAVPVSAKLDVAAAPAATDWSVVISEVYGGGGNSGATLKNDFIEIHNTGTAVTSIEGWSVQYAS